MTEDQQLLKALNQGETAEWRQVYLKYKDDLPTVAHSMVCDINTAEDCLQEAFVSLVSDRCRVSSNLKGYLLSCVVNRARDHLRRRNAQSDCQVNMSALCIDATDPANLLAESNEIRVVICALDKLPAEQREVIVLHLQGDMKFRQIAEMLDISINTAQSRYRYGMEKLRQLLTKKEVI